MRAAVPSMTGEEIEAMEYRDWQHYAKITDVWIARNLGGHDGA